MPSPAGSSTRVTDFHVADLAFLDAIIEGVKWGGAIGTGVSLTFSFPGLQTDKSYWSPSYGEAEPNKIVAFSQAERALVLKIFRELAAYTNLTFTEVADTSSRVGELRFARTKLSNDPQDVAHAYFPSEVPEGGDVWIIDGHKWNQWKPGQVYPYAETYYHEIGHALGLKHSFTGPHSLPASLDNTSFTVMSYTDVPQNKGGGIPQNTGYYCALDVQALQFIYGANMRFHAGNDVYGAANLPMAHTVWDAGGYDTVRSCLSIDLGATVRTGRFSVLGSSGAVHNYELVQKDIIEAAYGVRAGWHATGNDLDNKLVGAVLTTSTKTHGPAVMLGGGGNDLIVVEQTALAAQFGAANILRGGRGDDDLSGYKHADNLFGDSGNDTLKGSGGADVLSGGPGDDVLEGGYGADKYRFDFAGNGVDTIFSFDATDLLQFRAGGFGFGDFRGKIAAGQFVSAAGHIAVDENDYFLFDTESNTLWFDNDGSDAGLAVPVAVFEGNYRPHAFDIEII